VLGDELLGPGAGGAPLIDKGSIEIERNQRHRPNLEHPVPLIPGLEGCWT